MTTQSSNNNYFILQQFFFDHQLRIIRESNWLVYTSAIVSLVNCIHCGATATMRSNKCLTSNLTFEVFEKTSVFIVSVCIYPEGLHTKSNILSQVLRCCNEASYIITIIASLSGNIATQRKLQL